MKLLAQLSLPLLGQMWWTEHRQPSYLAAVQQLAGDKRCLHRLANSDVISDQQPHGIELERHEQGHELIGTRFNGDAGERAEWSGAGAESESHGVAQKPT